MSTVEPTKPAGGRARRPRVTSRKVIWIDRIVTGTITAGGISVIITVLGILVYLVAVVIPLFQGATLTRGPQYQLPDAASAGLLSLEVEEYRAVGLALLADGSSVAFDALTGRQLARTEPLAPVGPGPSITSFSKPPGLESIALGFSDGTVRLGKIAFETSFLGPEERDPQLEALPKGRRAIVGGSIVEHTPTGQFRKVRVVFEIGPPLALATSPIHSLDYRVDDGTDRLAFATGAGELGLSVVTRTENLITGESSEELSTVMLPTRSETTTPPDRILVTTRGDQLFAAWRDGVIQRYDLRDSENPVMAEETDLTNDPGAELTAMVFMNGEQSILAGDSRGVVRSWFRAAREGENGDGYQLVVAHTFDEGTSPIRLIVSSTRDKTFLAGADDGSLVLYHMTSEQRLAETSLGSDPIVTAQITPKGDGLLAVGQSGRVGQWTLQNPHPETTWKSIFTKVWYEGYAEPDYTWQSSSGTDDFEPKLSLIPLIFGTLKATVYSLLFAIPIALFGAIYTSEFLDRNLRAPLKSIVEIMASLPSVVLGFIAALVLAPIIENWVVASLLAFGMIPVAALASGYAWQILPRRITTRIEKRWQVVLLLAVVGASLWFGVRVANLFERVVFYGDFKGWLDGRIGSGVPGIAIVVWPFLFVAFLVADRTKISDVVGRFMAGRSQSITASIEAVKFMALVLLSILCAWGIGTIFAALGFDLRGELFGTYVQRNALIVGFVTGFAVIPIIYTISEDALSSVPQTLRSASLGCGATRWQTATRVVLPVALSGIFSAIMIGLGRAVGETMIVLMAAGNTPLMDFNIFNGLRTLSANIAVELPEAVKDGTLYRMLFLAALTLFVMTFVVNTIAEIVRQRFRKRAFQL